MVGFVVVVIGKYTQRMVIPVLWLGLLLLSSVSTHNAWSYRYYSWFCRCCRLSVSTICGRIMVGLLLFSASVSTLCGRIMFGFVVVVVLQ